MTSPNEPPSESERTELTRALVQDTMDRHKAPEAPSGPISRFLADVLRTTAVQLWALALAGVFLVGTISATFGVSLKLALIIVAIGALAFLVLWAMSSDL